MGFSPIPTWLCTFPRHKNKAFRLQGLQVGYLDTSVRCLKIRSHKSSAKPLILKEDFVNSVVLYAKEQHVHF